MYKRFIRWASDRLADDGVIGFVSNRAFLDSHQDDGFRGVVAQEFNELWAIDLKGNARTSGEQRRRESGNIFDDKIRVGVAIYFLVRREDANGFRVFYTAVDDYAKSPGKIAFIEDKDLPSFEFAELTPDSRNTWLNQSNSNFGTLTPLANKQTKLAKATDDERAVFRLYTMGVVTNRDEWVYDSDLGALNKKIRAFVDYYEEARAEHGGKDVDDAVLGTQIKWTRDLKRQLPSNITNRFERACSRKTTFRPSVRKFLYFNQTLNEMQYQLPDVFPNGSDNENEAICFCVNGKDFFVLSTDRVVDLHFTGDTQCLPLYRYTAAGERVSNITEWGVRRINEHYRREWGKDFDSIYPDGGIAAEDIFVYTYAVLHDPVYRHDYAADLLREFPRLPLYHDFDVWARMGKSLLDLHVGFETVEPYPLRRNDQRGAPTRVILRADKERGVIILDDKTTLAGVPPDAWRYRLGSRSALEWVLDQYKERKPKDPTIAEKFNTYRFADYKEGVIDLLQRVCAVSVQTMDIVDDMAYWDEEGRLIVFGDRDKHEMAMLGLASMARHDEEEDPEWLAAWQAAE